MLNEMVICYSTLHLALFSDWVLEPENRQFFGWKLIVLVQLHMIFQLYFVLKGIWIKIRKYFRKYTRIAYTKAKVTIKMVFSCYKPSFTQTPAKKRRNPFETKDKHASRKFKVSDFEKNIFIQEEI